MIINKLTINWLPSHFNHEDMMTETVSGPAQLSLRRAFVLQVIPGFPMLAVYLPAAWLFGRRGLPVQFALYTAILVGEVPATWLMMAYQRRREGGGPLFPWRAPLPAWQYIAIGVPLAIIGLLVMGALTPTVGEAIRDGLFAWVPAWAVPDMTADPRHWSRPVRIALAVLGLFGATLAGGVTQELYARGFLLPRTEHAGRMAPLFNAAAFAVLHLASPWSWPVFFLVALPWAYAVWWRRSIGLGLAGHVGMLGIMSLGLFAAVLAG
jgi:hypothetical protein